MLFFASLALFALFPVLFACEGECIVKVTNKVIDKYREPTAMLLDRTERSLATRFQLDASANCTSFLQVGYSKRAYEALEYALFPCFFHGKCQRPSPNGTLADPPGCPNPDCPVVCGTPGSMVHFYSNFTSIAFRTQQEIFSNLTLQNSDAFKDVATCVRDAMTKNCDRTPRTASPSTRSLSRLFSARFPLDMRSSRPNCDENSDATIKYLYDTLHHNLVESWPDICDAGHDLQRCKWEKEIKKFILQFP
ncbi:hypothetical protein BDP27DRAFT_1356597 [Rhodocollybia butyracea]|uniref:Uncharacterized protein n=1 Tax=Rhodocollybia butyracea TaxID=206335 RepID=A0A9P5QBC9_9AGAR|nr:hypothetical protein BDP27DRAFT_1356597 [Rhodocollybia butyracea]